VICPLVIIKMLEQGERYMYCTPGGDYYLFGPTGVWMALFCLSKIPELMDTVFLVIRKRPVIFLHWWHHRHDQCRTVVCRDELLRALDHVQVLLRHECR
jgi:hypothetical protein